MKMKKENKVPPYVNRYQKESGDVDLPLFDCDLREMWNAISVCSEGSQDKLGEYFCHYKEDFFKKFTKIYGTLCIFDSLRKKENE